jgi:hypothetical protein
MSCHNAAESRAGKVQHCGFDFVGLRAGRPVRAQSERVLKADLGWRTRNPQCRDAAELSLYPRAFARPKSITLGIGLPSCSVSRSDHRSVAAVRRRDRPGIAAHCRPPTRVHPGSSSKSRISHSQRSMAPQVYRKVSVGRSWNSRATQTFFRDHADSFALRRSIARRAALATGVSGSADCAAGGYFLFHHHWRSLPLHDRHWSHKTVATLRHGLNIFLIVRDSLPAPFVSRTAGIA